MKPKVNKEKFGVTGYFTLYSEMKWMVTLLRVKNDAFACC